MSKLYAIRQTKFEKYWYDFVEDFTSAELNRDCISNNLTYVKECQNNLETLNPAWKNSEIVEFRELGDLIDFENLYYKSLEQRAFLEKQLAEKEDELTGRKKLCDLRYDQLKQAHQEKIEFAVQQLEQFKSELVNKVSPVKLSYTDYVQEVFNKINNQIKQLKEME